jgi:hypothetical protein
MAKHKDPVRFKVRGQYPFPIDMLRYDGCIPDSERDSYLIIGVSDAIARTPGEVEITLKSFYDLPRGPTVARWRSFAWEVTEIWSERDHKFVRVFRDDKPERNQAASNEAVLHALKDVGLTFGDCVKAFAALGDELQFVKFARDKHQEEGEVEIDEPTVVSISEGVGPDDEGGAYVMAWVYVEAPPKTES